MFNYFSYLAMLGMGRQEGKARETVGALPSMVTLKVR